LLVISAQGTNIVRSTPERNQINWLTAIVMVIYHALAVVALFRFSWTGLGIAALLWWISGSLGIGMGYHRLLTHRGYKTPKWVEYFLTACGTLALEGGPMFWVATHRVHHQLTDKPGDPHSPRDGKWWSHMGWIIMGRALHQSTAELSPYVPDLRKDKVQVWLSRYHWVAQVVVGVTVLAIWGWNVALWAVFLRTVVGLHATWLVNSATHIWGSQRFATEDDSTNNFLIAMLTFGEGWHNNHHAHPSSARHGLSWWQIDTNWYQIKFLELIGLAKDIKLPRADSRVRDLHVQPETADSEAELTAAYGD
jgi:stearoyl-CoA desaturase (delta-9 desaturase)